MNFDAMFTRGSLPWRPSDKVDDLDVWHEYEIPLVGTFQFGGETVLFSELGDVDSSMTTGWWAYTKLKSEAPASFKTVDDLRLWVYEQFENAEAAFAFTRDLKMVRFSDPRKVENMYDGGVTFIQEVLDAIEDRPKRAKAQFAAVQAEAESVERELIGA